MTDTANTTLAASVDQIFLNTVENLRDAVDRLETRNRALDAVAAKQPDTPVSARAQVDVIELEMNFKGVALDASSTMKKLLWSNKQTSSTLEIRLTTRVRCG